MLNRITQMGKTKEMKSPQPWNLATIQNYK